VAKQLTIRGIPDEVARRLARLSAARGTSVNQTVLAILSETLGVDARRTRLQRYVTWTDDDAREFRTALESQRVVDAELWR
jgi:plasmid stability protein